MTNTKTPRASLRFPCTDHYPADGSRIWAITRPDGTVLGEIEKTTAWVGDGYLADAYEVRLEECAWADFPGDLDLDLEAYFSVDNIWNRGVTRTAREAFTAAKNFAREVVARVDAAVAAAAANLEVVVHQGDFFQD